MEKRKRHYSLDILRELINKGDWKITRTATLNAWLDFKLLQADIRDVVLNLGTQDFYKSMTSYDAPFVWQDVYRPMVKGIMAYIKLSIMDDQTVVIQFKRK